MGAWAPWVHGDVCDLRSARIIGRVSNSGMTEGRATSWSRRQPEGPSQRVRRLVPPSVPFSVPPPAHVVRPSGRGRAAAVPAPSRTPARWANAQAITPPGLPRSRICPAWRRAAACGATGRRRVRAGRGAGHRAFPAMPPSRRRPASGRSGQARRRCRRCAACPSRGPWSAPCGRWSAAALGGGGDRTRSCPPLVPT
ncbi:MAG: hypothetical protein V7646_1343 [Pseudonocardia sp.]